MSCDALLPCPRQTASHGHNQPLHLVCGASLSPPMPGSAPGPFCIFVKLTSVHWKLAECTESCHYIILH